MTSVNRGWARSALWVKKKDATQASKTGWHAGAPWLVLMLGVPAAHAQTPPGAGELLRETQRSLQTPQPAARAVPTPGVRPMPEDSKATRVAVKQLVIEGATLIPVTELQALLADRIGQSLTLAELEHAAQVLATHYRERGWYARVYLPQQDVTDGLVRLQVLEGRWGGSRVSSASGQRVDAQRVQTLVTQRMQPGEPLSAADLERGLLLANDLPGVRATGVLEAGQVRGQTQLALQVEDTPFVTGDIGLNNHGVKSTGREQLTGGVAFNNLAGVGDQLTLRGLLSDKVQSAVARYSLPVGNDGARLAAHASALGYKLGGSYQALQARGSATTAGLTLSYPLVRQSERNLNLTAGYEHRRYDDDMLAQPLRRHRVNALVLGASGDARDSLGGGGINLAALQLTLGTLDISDIAGDKAADALGPRTDGRYAKLAFQLQRLQALGSSGWQLQAALSGQMADGNLGSSERFTLGGPQQVRAYPVNEAGGDEGLLFKLDLQRDLGHGWAASVFYDAGSVRQQKAPWAGWQGGSAQRNRYSLQGVGVGLNWRAQGWVVAATAAVPVGGNPGQDALGRNGDGSKASSARYWLSLNRAF